MSEHEGPLAGLKVVDLSTSLPGVMATQFLADSGADVLMVERPGGSPLRANAGWPGLARGKRSVVLDLADEAGRAVTWSIIRESDVAVMTFRPRTLREFGFTPEALAAANPRLVSATISGWGPSGPWADLKGYEGLVMAKIGAMTDKSPAASRPGPAFVATFYASYAAAQTAVHGILSALYERETSHLGQNVATDLVRAIATMDTYGWFMDLVAKRWPDAFPALRRTWDDEGRPQGRLIYHLLIAPTKDGHWLQFAETGPRQFRAFVDELGLRERFDRPGMAAFPDISDPDLRMDLWEEMTGRVARRTMDEWQRIFRSNPDVLAELFRQPPDALEHPQVVHDHRVVVVQDPDLGPVRQPSTMVHSDGLPVTKLRPAPRLGEGAPKSVAGPPTQAAATPAGTAPSGLPLAGVTIMELGSMFAGPYGATLLTDLGARVIKIEPLSGDNMRYLTAFPEAGGGKVLQGKESVAVDLATAEGREIVHRIAQRCDIVLQTYRAGAAARAGVDAKTLKALNPDLVYLSAPGYGVDGPYGGSPAYAPSIGAASGLALSDVPDAAVKLATPDGIRASAIRLYAAGATQSAQADGVAALGVASAMLLGLLARRRGRALGELTTTMLASNTHCLIDRNLSYQGMPAVPVPDPGLHGYSALYRLYEANDGWVFLAAPKEREWTALTLALGERGAPLDDPRFASAASRSANDQALAGALASVFAARSRDDWERDLTAADVGCVAVPDDPPEVVLQFDEWFEAGYAVEADSPIFGVHRRLSSATRFSRSATKADGGCTLGQHTDAVLSEIGYGAAEIAGLRERGIVG
jgi:crotonobetainyl-CoA:carnitine CoA-transferase CaiB-like acyl-CoA transferase